MSVSICIKPGDLKYNDPILSRYCNIENVICVSYSMDYKSRLILLKSNLRIVEHKDFSFNPDMCLEKSNFSVFDSKLEEALLDFEKYMKSVKDEYSSCMRYKAFYSAIETILGNLFQYSKYAHISISNKYINDVKEVCAYGNEELYLIGVTSGDIKELPEFSQIAIESA